MRKPFRIGIQIGEYVLAFTLLYSLFEEQLTHIRVGRSTTGTDLEKQKGTSRSENPFPRQSRYPRTPGDYLEHIRKAKEAVNIPVIASLNCI